MNLTYQKIRTKRDKEQLFKLIDTVIQEGLENREYFIPYEQC